jgi:hypothetical protein
LSHLIGGFVCKRDRENIPARNLFLGDEISDAMRDDACFARAGARKDEERTLCGKDSFTLLFVKL